MTFPAYFFVEINHQSRGGDKKKLGNKMDLDTITFVLFSIYSTRGKVGVYLNFFFFFLISTGKQLKKSDENFPLKTHLVLFMNEGRRQFLRCQ